MFKGKVVIITGACSDIGAGAAVAFAKEGAKLVLGGHNEENFRRTVKDYQNLTTEDILPLLGDLMNEGDCNALVDKASQRFDHLDILLSEVNHAGSARQGNIYQLTIEDVDYLFNVLVRSVVIITKRAVSHLKETRGSIVNVSSVTADRVSVQLTAYGMAKAAINHFTRSLAQDLGPSGVRANCVLPGVIDTSIFMGPGRVIPGQPEKKAELLDKLGENHTLRHTGTTDEVANLIIFLSSDKASFITGVMAPVDGGLTGRNVF